MDTLQSLVNQLRNLNLPVDVSDKGKFVTANGVVLKTAAPSQSMLDTYMEMNPLGFKVLLYEIASSVMDEVEEMHATTSSLIEFYILES